MGSFRKNPIFLNFPDLKNSGFPILKKCEKSQPLYKFHENCQGRMIKINLNGAFGSAGFLHLSRTGFETTLFVHPCKFFDLLQFLHHIKNYLFIRIFILLHQHLLLPLFSFFGSFEVPFAFFS
jgi:hypothetical protein